MNDRVVIVALIVILVMMAVANLIRIYEAVRGKLSGSVRVRKMAGN